MNLYEFLCKLMEASTDGTSEILLRTKTGTTMVWKISKTKEGDVLIE